MNFNFGEVLTRAWQIIWKHKVLWIFGILAGCGQGGGGSGINFNMNSRDFERADGSLPPQVLRWFQAIEQNLMTYVAIGIAVICLLWIVAVFLGTIGRIGLIRGTAQADGGAESLIFGQLFSESMPYFWRILVLSLIVALPIVFVFAALVAGLLVFLVPVSVGSGGGGNAPLLGLFAIIPFFIGCMCLLVPVMFVVGMIIRQAERAIVLEDMRVLPAISRGWDVFRKNLGPILVMAIIITVIGLIVGFVIAIPIFILVFPAALAFMFGNAQNWTPLILMGICFCLYIPVVMALNGVVMSYIESAWTLTYLRLTQPQDDAPVILEANA